MWIWIVLGALILLFLLALCVPVNTVFYWDSARRPKTGVTIVWLFGIVSFTPRGQAVKKKIVAGKKKAGGRPSLRKILKIITIRGLFGKIAALLGSVWRRIRIEELKGNFKLELNDPAEAGFIYAALGAISPLLRPYPLNQFKLQPVLGEEVALRGSARAELSLLPITLVVPSLKFIFSRPVLKAAKISIFEKA